MDPSNNGNSNRFDIDMTPINDFMNKMDNFFNESFRHINSYFNINPFRINMYEDEINVIVEAELPGYRREQIQLEIINNHLRIIALEKAVNKEQNDTTKYVKKEQSYRKMNRVISLPFTIVEEETTATLNNGILKITIPKRFPNKKTIDINE